MIGIIGIIAALTVLALSLLITRIATVALSLTGLSYEAAKFQARSAFTGTGFTTSEAERVVDHPVRRKIIMAIMVARSAGFVTILISLMLSFATEGAHELSRLIRLSWLSGGVLVLWIISQSDFVERWLAHVIKRALDRWTDLEACDYVELLKLSGEYSVREVHVKENDWLAGKRLDECNLDKEGVLVMGVHRRDGSYVGAPRNDTKLYSGDTLILYGRSQALENLDVREAGAQGEAEHRASAREQEQKEAKQEQEEREYEEKREEESRQEQEEP
ncbi:MAG: TrkA C-terminal domain-containing protein [Candidatus Sumerlaeota bacterium]